MNPNDPFARPLPFLAGATLCLFLVLIVAADRISPPALTVGLIAPQPPATEGAP